jgi:hypothetical protein
LDYEYEPRGESIMKRLLVLLIIVLLLAPAATGKTTTLSPNVVSKIEKGTVLLLSGEALCTGHHLTPTVILTAYHCVEDTTLHKAASAVMVLEPEMPTKDHPTGLIAVVGYTDRSLDLALVFLPESYPGVPVIEVADTGIKVGQEVWISSSAIVGPNPLEHGVVNEIIIMAFNECNVDARDAVGTAPHQTVFVNGRSEPGWSGSAVFNSRGELVGVLVGRVLLGVTCADPPDKKPIGYEAVVVGPDAVWAFLVAAGEKHPKKPKGAGIPWYGESWRMSR